MEVMLTASVMLSIASYNWREDWSSGTTLMVDWDLDRVWDWWWWLWRGGGDSALLIQNKHFQSALVLQRHSWMNPFVVGSQSESTWRTRLLTLPPLKLMALYLALLCSYSAIAFLAWDPQQRSYTWSNQVSQGMVHEQPTIRRYGSIPLFQSDVWIIEFFRTTPCNEPLVGFPLACNGKEGLSGWIGSGGSEATFRICDIG